MDQLSMTWTIKLTDHSLTNTNYSRRLGTSIAQYLINTTPEETRDIVEVCPPILKKGNNRNMIPFRRFNSC
ncbi:hypothetical protein NT6N_26760 [Oceaniferula spumae]|uniref:Uncharacterized protein n=1 Tax=Oceaniferula spumae TaxID=2979115 RepID=A0AAT9FP02_9BACT